MGRWRKETCGEEKLDDKQKALLDAQFATERGFNFQADYLAKIRN